MPTDEPWYESAFRSHYLDVYTHRDDRSARSEVDFALGVLGVDAGHRVLDLACGAGRHSRAMAERGLRVAGIDLSADLLVAAQNHPDRPDVAPEFVRGDMRRLPFPEGFAAVTMFFTSFGYFETEEENAAVLREVARVLEPKGRFLLDYLNREAVIDSLVPESVDEIRGFRVRSERSITPDGRRVEKRVRIHEGERLVRDYRESVRMYAPGEVSSMLVAAGIWPEDRWGDLAGRPFTGSSSRLVVLGRKEC